jgi:soluble lytic murein transglycosylase
LTKTGAQKNSTCYVQEHKGVGFFLYAAVFFINFSSCAAQQPQADFYEGLRIRAAAEEGAAAQAEARKKTAAFFEKALNSANVYVRQAAAEELAGLLYEGAEIPAAVMGRMRREAAGSWAAAFDALYGPPGRDTAKGRGSAAAAPEKQKALAFLLDSGESGPAVLFALREIRGRDASFFTGEENAAIEGHFAASRSRYREALVFFRELLEGGDSGGGPAGESASAGKSPAAVPPLFFEHPLLLHDLGRSFQYAAPGPEGIELFLKWEKNLADRDAALAADGTRDADNVRFALLFFAARITRQQRGECQALFERALPLAPDAAQADACIWYMLDSVLERGPAAAIRLLEKYAPQWHDAAYFADVLDKISRELAARRQWEMFAELLPLVQEYADAATIAKYTWIAGRAIEEGCFPAAEKSVLEYMRIAYNTGTASLYYRFKSAAALSEPFLPLPAEPPSAAKAQTGKAAPPSQAAEFLNGFFAHNAAEFAPRAIRALEKELSVSELRILAEALGKAGLYAESMRLVSVYMERPGYILERYDMELFYPRPYKELVEKYAEETGIAAALLFGLIRTESAFQSGVVSRAGAVGLTQLMPATAEEMAGRIRRRGGPDYTQGGANGEELNLRDSEINIHIGAVYLAYLTERMEDSLLALLSYNGGMNRVRRWRTASNRNSALPTDLFLETIEYPETREYGRKVLAAAAVYEAL